MSLSISYTNVLIDKTPSITDPGADEFAEYISDPDHSLNYTSGTTEQDFSINYGSQSGISYVAVSGHNAATSAPCHINLYDGTSLIDSVYIKRNNNIMFTFTERNFTQLIIEFAAVLNSSEITLSFIAAGKHFEITTGEQAGYKRLWLLRNTTQKTTKNLQSAPVSSIKKRKALVGNLSLPHQLKEFTEDDWQDFIDFTFEQPFFIKEQTAIPESTYTCFDAVHDIKAHPQTRKLNAITLKFNAYNGL